jgi:hypothetical protein
MNWLLVTGLICLTVGIVKALGWILGGVVLIALATLIELW